MFARAAIAAAFVVTIAAPAAAGPDEIVTALTGTPATLFDLGLGWPGTTEHSFITRTARS